MTELDFPPVSFAQWRARVEGELAGADYERALVRRDPAGLPRRPLYTEADARGPDPAGLPGAWPFTRGRRPLNAAGGWARVPRLDELVATELRAELEGGATGLWLRLDRAGVASGLELCAALADLPLEGATLILDRGALTPFAPAELRELGAAQLVNCCDPLGALAEHGWLPRPLDESLAALAPLVRDSADALAGARSLWVSTRVYHDAGATAVQELAFALATAVEYLRACDAAGLAPDRAAPALAFSFAIGRDLFEGAAKLRAARLLWAMAQRAAGVAEPQGAWLHAATSERCLTRRDPWTNLLRGTVESLGAVIGGADAVTTLAFDAVLGRPEALGRRIARNTQTVLAEESHLGAVTDPAGGSHFVEALTEELARAAWELFRELERAGGLRAELLSGGVRTRVEAAAAERCAALARRELVITGVSEYPLWDERPLERAPAPPPAPAPSDAGQRLAPFEPRRDAAAFEHLREAAEAATPRPAIFLAALGPLAEHNTRATFAANLFAAGGLAVPAGEGTAELEPAEAAASLAEAFRASGARSACLVGSDRRYATHAAAAAAALRDAGAAPLLLAGVPGETQAELRAAGVEDFVFLGLDLPPLLSRLLIAAGAAPAEVPQ